MRFVQYGLVGLQDVLDQDAQHFLLTPRYMSGRHRIVNGASTLGLRRERGK